MIRDCNVGFIYLLLLLLLLFFNGMMVGYIRKIPK